MNQLINSKKEPYTVEVEITIKGHRTIGLDYSKRFNDGKNLGMFNDFQSYEKLNVESVNNFLRNKNVKLDEITFKQACKSATTYLYIVNCIKAPLVVN